MFVQEFSGRGERIQQQDLEGRLRELRAPWQDQPCPEEWPSEDQLAADAHDVLGTMRNGKATVEDSVPTEYLRAAGPGHLRAFARLARRSLQDGAPSRWRTGCMVPVPRKQRVPQSAKSARGVLLACHAGKIYSRIVRTKMQHLLPEAAQGRQSGGVKGGSTAAPQIVLSLFIKKMRKEQKCAAALFTDIRAAFYSVFAEVALGSLL